MDPDDFSDVSPVPSDDPDDNASDIGNMLAAMDSNESAESEEPSQGTAHGGRRQKSGRKRKKKRKGGRKKKGTSARVILFLT